MLRLNIEVKCTVLFEIIENNVSQGSQLYPIRELIPKQFTEQSIYLRF